MLRFMMAGRLRLHGRDLARLQRIADPVVVTVLFVQLLGNAAWNHPELQLQPWLWVGGCTALLFPLGGVYGSFRNNSLLLLTRRVVSSWLLVCTGVLGLSFATKTTASFSRVNASLWAMLALLVLLLSHVGLRQLLRVHRSRGGNSRTLIYWGIPEAAAAFAMELQRNSWQGLRLVAWFGPQAPNPDTDTSGLPRWGGGMVNMKRWLEQNEVDRIVFSHVTRNGVEMADVLRLFGDTCVPVIYAPHWAHPSMRFKVDIVGDQYCINLWGGDRLMTDRQLKRGFDLLISGAGLLLISPLLLLIAIAVRLSGPGPVLFRQDRYGLDGRRFRIYKFRTMQVTEAGDTPGLRQATRNDPRVTPVGRFLRRWSLDELPQLVNVVKGEMSLVGPRPHAVDHNEHYRRRIPGYMQRHAFKPGITGLAQIEGLRGETNSLESMAQRIDADLRYARDWSLKLDIKILLKTLLRLRSPNAF
jgi:putative colanic acid biosysnthesis UDP-glucose lipid carrier transferase